MRAALSTPVPSRPKLFRGAISLGVHSVLSDRVLFVQFFLSLRHSNAACSSFPSGPVSPPVLIPSSPLLLSSAIYSLRSPAPLSALPAPHVLPPCDRQVRQQRGVGGGTAAHRQNLSPQDHTSRHRKNPLMQKSNIKLIPAAARGGREGDGRGEGGGCFGVHGCNFVFFFFFSRAWRSLITSWGKTTSLHALNLVAATGHICTSENSS